MDPRLVEDRYDWAAALEVMSLTLRDDARQLWQQYLSVDSTSDRARGVKRYLSDEKTSKKTSDAIASLLPSSANARGRRPVP
jgi:hypothetical protein